MVRPVLVGGHGFNEGPLAGKDLGEKFRIGRENQTGNQGTPPQQLTLLRKIALP